MILALGIAAALTSGCVPVDGDRILASHLAAANPLFAGVDPGTVVAYAPSPGAMRAFAAGELARLARRFNLSGTPASGACFERATEPLDAQKLLAAMSRALPGARIGIVEYSRYAAPRGSMEFPLDGLDAPPAAGPAQGIARWRGFVRDAAGRKFSIWARVRVAARVQQVVAAQALKPGEPIDAAQVRIASLEAFPLRAGSLERLDQALGRKPRRALPAGTVLDSSMVDEPVDVERGATVDVEAHSGAVVLKLTAVAETAGVRGQTVRLKNPASGKQFTAKVEGKNKVVAGL